MLSKIKVTTFISLFFASLVFIVGCCTSANSRRNCPENLTGVYDYQVASINCFFSASDPGFDDFYLTREELDELKWRVFDILLEGNIPVLIDYGPGVIAFFVSMEYGDAAVQLLENSVTHPRLRVKTHSN